MDLHDLMSLVGHLPCFDLATLVQLTGERRESIVTQMHRLARSGRVVPLRRGLYTLAEPYRRARVGPAALANVIYRPSYLSCEWALSFHGLIPEATVVLTSVTTRVPRRFHNPYGDFQYRNVKEELFCGYQALTLVGERVLVATAEKALLDFFHLSRGEWTEARLSEMRFAPASATGLDLHELDALAQRLGSPRVRRTLSRLAKLLEGPDEGVVL